MATGVEVGLVAHEVRTYERLLWAAVFSADQRYVALVCSDNTARVWLVWPDDLIAEAGRRVTRNLTRNEWRQYIGDVPYRKTFPNLP